jgi:hypothetical protein
MLLHFLDTGSESLYVGKIAISLLVLTDAYARVAYAPASG